MPKSLVPGKKFLTNQSMAASFNSNPIPIGLMDDVGIQIDVTSGSSPVGTFTVQVSANHVEDLNGNVVTAGTWATVQTTPGTDLAIAITGNGTFYFDLALLSAPYCRLVYTRTSGSGTANAWAATKSLS